MTDRPDPLGVWLILGSIVVALVVCGLAALGAWLARRGGKGGRP